MQPNKNLKNTISLFSIELIARLISFLAVTYLARTLTTSNFGIINISLAILSYAIVIANGGLIILGTKKIAANIESSQKLTGDILFTRLFLSIILFIISLFVLYNFIESKDLIYTTIAYLLFLLPSAILLEWFFHGIQSMDTITFGRVIGLSGYLIFILLFVTQSDDIVLTGIGWTLGGILNAVFLLIIYFKRNYSIKFSFSKSNFIGLIKESYHLGLAQIIAQFVVMFPVIYLGIVSGNTDAGIFSAAYKLIIFLLIFDRIFNALFFPKIVKRFQNNSEVKELNEILNNILKIISFVSLLISLLVFIYAEAIVTSVFGLSYIDAATVFQILIGIFFITLLNSVFTYTLIAMNREKIFTFSLFGGMIVFLVFVPVFTHFFNAAGSAAALVLFELTALIIMYLKSKNFLNINIFRIVIVPVIFIIIILFPLILLLHDSKLLQIILLLPAFLGLIFIMGIRKKDIDFIKKTFI